MKHARAIAGLFVLAVLTPSCLGGGSAPSKNVKAPPAMWQTQQRVPTTSDLRAVAFANFGTGIIAGKDGTIFRSDDGGASWWQQNFTPSFRTGDIAALGFMNKEIHAVGKDAGNGNGRDWKSIDTLTWTTDDIVPTNADYTDVGLTSNGVGPQFPVDVYRLRRDGKVHFTLGSGGDNFPGGDTSPFTNANGLTNILPQPGFLGTTFIAGDNGGAGKIYSAGYGTLGTLPAGTKTFRRVVQSPSGQPFACGDNLSNQGIVVYIATRTVQPAQPTAPPTAALVATATGNVTDGTHEYALTFIETATSFETAPGSSSASVLVDAANKQVTVSNFEAAPAGWTRRLYRTLAGTTNLRFLTALTNVQTTFTDNVADGSLGAAPPAIGWKPDVWVDLNTPAGLPSLNSLYFPTTTLGYVVGNAGTIYRMSFDTGSSTWIWTNMNPGGALTTQNLYSVYFADANIGWAVGDKGTVLKTSLGTAAVGPWWNRMDYGAVGINWNALSFTDDGKHGIAVGNDALTPFTPRIFRTINGGATWTSMTTGIAGKTLLGASVPPVGKVSYVCGTGGVLLRNDDTWSTSPGTWTQVSGTTGTDTYRAVLFPQDGNKGVCVGDNGSGTAPVLLRTTDGVSWSSPTNLPATSPTASYNALSTNVLGTKVYASGSDGVISVSTLDTTLGFDTWTDIAPATGLALTLPAVQSPEGTSFTAMAAGSDGNVYKLSAGWTGAAAIPWGSEKPISLGFNDDLNGLVVTDGGGVYYTTTGGDTWTKTYPHTKTKPRCLWASLTVPGLGYIGCDDGVIMKTLTLGH